MLSVLLPPTQKSLSEMPHTDEKSEPASALIGCVQAPVVSRRQTEPLAVPLLLVTHTALPAPADQTAVNDGGAVMSSGTEASTFHVPVAYPWSCAAALPSASCAVFLPAAIGLNCTRDGAAGADVERGALAAVARHLEARRHRAAEAGRGQGRRRRRRRALVMVNCCVAPGCPLATCANA